MPAMVELLCSVSNAVAISELQPSFMSKWENVWVDAATPLPLIEPSCGSDWEAEYGWTATDRNLEILTGYVVREAAKWKQPSRSAVRALMESGDGPPMLRQGCKVMRGIDWDQEKYGDADGKSGYDIEKAKREEEKKKSEESPEDEPDPASVPSDAENPPGEDQPQGDDPNQQSSEKKETGKEATKKKKKQPSPKLPIGTVLSIESWNGVPGMGRRVKWKLTGEIGLYRYGGDGGNFDLSHIEVNDKGTRVRKRYPLPESSEQCAARHGFGRGARESLVLRMRRSERRHVEKDGAVTIRRDGILEWPDFGAGIVVECIHKPNGSLLLKEKDLVYGSKDAGWEARFGRPSYVPGTEILLKPSSSNDSEQADVDAKSPYDSMFEELVGSTSFSVDKLRRKEDAGKLTVNSTFHFQRSRSGVSDSLTEAPMPSPIEAQ
ncbi:MAG: hypothetical protein SGILL_004604 [Bacillariaceae sp.]